MRKRRLASKCVFYCGTQRCREANRGRCAWPLAELRISTTAGPIHVLLGAFFEHSSTRCRRSNRRSERNFRSAAVSCAVHRQPRREEGDRRARAQLHTRRGAVLGRRRAMLWRCTEHAAPRAPRARSQTSPALLCAAHRSRCSATCSLARLCSSSRSTRSSLDATCASSSSANVYRRPTADAESPLEVLRRRARLLCRASYHPWPSSISTTVTDLIGASAYAVARARSCGQGPVRGGGRAGRSCAQLSCPWRVRRRA